MRRIKVAFIVSKEKRKQLLRESDNLKSRISSLFKTIRLEIMRKNDELKTLQNKYVLCSHHVIVALIHHHHYLRIY